MEKELLTHDNEILFHSKQLCIDLLFFGMNRDVDQGQRPSDFAQKTPNMQFSVVGSAPDFESRDPGSSLAAALHGTFLLVPLGKVLQ